MISSILKSGMIILDPEGDVDECALEAMNQGEFFATGTRRNSWGESILGVLLEHEDWMKST